MKFICSRVRPKDLRGLSILILSIGLMSCGAAPQNGFSENFMLEPLPKIPTGGPENASFQYKCLPVSNLAQQQIKSLEDKTWGREYCGARSSVKSETVEVILVTIEGACQDNKTEYKGGCGNNYQRYMLGIKDGETIDSIAVGESYVFQAGGVALQDQTVILSGKAYVASDAKCCPSLPETRTYSIIEKSFVEVF